ncbi:MAG TPA: tetratricopeptide repeat protein [Candidatus Sulfopaludibacter sp.]|nr:tetratricopeptide repeat protein [Candidatus Sulfopaludibacter sp.]
MNQSSNRRLICLLLVLVTLALYLPATYHAFTNLDDDQYVTANPHVKAGLTWRGVAWAFRSGYADNWHPLTWISHMLDCQLYGLNPAGHHFTSVLLHIANAVLLFLFLNRTTGTTWRSGFVAALFAWHPLHVESVAWVAERKDMLSAFFWLLTLMAYARFVEESKVESPKSKIFFAATLLMFACGLMSKPMVVTLPFVLLLLDFWPFQRISNFQLQGSNLRLLAEKIPFFALSLAASIITFLAQQAAGAVSSLETVPLPARLANALLSYLRYVLKTFWPSDLAVLYPLQTHSPPLLILVSTLLILACSVLVVWLARRHPYLFVGWFWYLGTLVPVIGLVQVGRQSMADRYMYLPSIGLFIVVVWSFWLLLTKWPASRWFAFGAGLAALAGCLAVSWTQLKYWQNSMTLFVHAGAVTSDNYVAYSHIGETFEEMGQFDQAVAFQEQSARINPRYAQGQSELGAALADEGRLPEALECFRNAVQLQPDNAILHYNLGTALFDSGEPDAAAAQFAKALQLFPDLAQAHRSLGLVLLKQGKAAAARQQFSEAVKSDPGDAEARFDYGLTLLDENQPAAAAVQFYRQIALTPYQPAAHYRLAQALFRQYKSSEAIAEFWQALRLAPNSADALNELAWILATDPDPKLRSGTVAVRLAERACDLTRRRDAATLTTLGAAYAEAGRFPEAIAAALKARDLASADGEKELADRNDGLLKLYQSERPYRQPM